MRKQIRKEYNNNNNNSNNNNNNNNDNDNDNELDKKKLILFSVSLFSKNTKCNINTFCKVKGATFQ